MVEGVDYNETYANTPNPAAIRCVLAVATRDDMEAKSGDVNTAFLSADIISILYYTYTHHRDLTLTQDCRTA